MAKRRGRQSDGIRRRASSPSPEEEAFLAAYDPSGFERPSVTVDVVLLTVRDGALFTFVVRRPDHPFKGRWALPGGFVHMSEPLEKTANRILRAKCGVENVYVEQLATFGDPRRDPRTRVISVAHYALVDARRLEGSVLPDTEATIAEVKVPWEREDGGPAHLVNGNATRMPLAFDHDEILGLAVKRIRGKLGYTPIGFQLLPERFTLLELQAVHETLLGRKLNKDSFRRRMLASEQLEATGIMQTGVDHRPAELYRFLARSAV